VIARQGLFALSIGVGLYAVAAYLLWPVGSVVHPDMRAGFEAHALAIRLHAFCAAVALLLGPFQFAARWRTRHPSLHRTLGRIYLGVGVGVGGTSGLYLAMHAYGGVMARAGFAGLALAWLYTAVRAYASARARSFDAHRRWMIRNYALSFAAVTLRIYVPAGFAAGVPFEVAYPAIAWLCWMPNLVIAQRVVGSSPRT